MEKELQPKFTEITYNNAARAYAEKFEDIGARTVDVDRAFGFMTVENPRVVEIGCGGGREAEYIITKTDNYIGMDISSGMLEMARKKLPEANFVQADIAGYEFPKAVDIVFAFASLLHSSREELSVVFCRMHDSLNEGGIVYVSLKRKEEYSQAVTKDECGPRQFYYYTREALKEVAGDGFEEVFYEEQERIEPWFTMILKKK